MDTLADPMQLHASTIATQLHRISGRLAATDPDPIRLRTQLLQAQRDVVDTLAKLNAVLGGPALWPSAPAAGTP
jgi:hypothetical protein